MTEVLWRPDPERVSRTRIVAFRDWLRANRDLDLPDYAALWEWSTTDLEGFWGAVAEFLQVRFHAAPSRVLGSETMPGASWFPGATINYAEHALRPGPGKADDDLALIFEREDGRSEQRS